MDGVGACVRNDDEEVDASSGTSTREREITSVQLGYGCDDSREQTVRRVRDGERGGTHRVGRLLALWVVLGLHLWKAARERLPPSSEGRAAVPGLLDEFRLALLVGVDAREGRVEGLRPTGAGCRAGRQGGERADREGGGRLAQRSTDRGMHPRYDLGVLEV